MIDDRRFAVIVSTRSHLPARPEIPDVEAQGHPYVLFYRVDDAIGTIWVIAAWSAVRGSGPELP